MRQRTPQYSIDTPVNYLLLLGISFFFWVVGYIHSAGFPAQSDAPATPLWEMVCRALSDKTVTYLTGLLLLLGGAFLTHRVNYALAITRERTWMPFFLYLFLISTNPDYFPLKSTSLGIFCLVWAIYQLFSSYHDGGAVEKMFNAFFFIGAGSLLWIHILWFFPIFWWGMYDFKILNRRTLLASLTGAGVIYWFRWGWCAWRHDYAPLADSFSLLKADIFNFAGNYPIIEWARVLFVGGLALIATVNILMHEHDDNLRTRQFLSFLVVFTVASFILSLLYEQSSNEFLGITCMPVSILSAHYFIVRRNGRKYRFYYALILSFIILSVVYSIRDMLPA
jgi:hypothetical protein